MHERMQEQLSEHLNACTHVVHQPLSGFIYMFLHLKFHGFQQPDFLHKKLLSYREKWIATMCPI